MVFGVRVFISVVNCSLFEPPFAYLSHAPPRSPQPLWESSETVPKALHRASTWLEGSGCHYLS